jgi:competence protein ComEA
MLERLTFGVAVLASLVLLVLGVGSRWRPPAPLTPLHATVHAHVAGAVVAPGAYALPWGSRVEDLIGVAGGLLASADPHLVPWSAPLTDGAAWVVATRLDPRAQARIDVNGAAAHELVGLPGIGPVIAARIIALRPYHRVEDLLRVTGIGEARLATLRPLVTLGPP